MLYITISIITDNANPIIGEIVLASSNVGISISLILGYSTNNPALISANNIKYIIPPIMPPKPEIRRLSASPPMAINVLNPTEKAKPP